jgi:DNA-binding transcriptional regulator YiaG
MLSGPRYRKRNPVCYGMEPMKPDELARCLEVIGMSNYQFCKMLGINDRTGRNWSGERAPIQPPVAGLLRLAVRLRLKPARLAKLISEAL